MNIPQVLVAQLGARKHYQEPLLFHRLGILERLYTDFYSDNILTNILSHSLIYYYLPNFIKKALERYEPGLKGASIIHFPKFGYQYVQAVKKASPEEISRIFTLGGQQFCQLIIKYGLGNANTIYGFNSACLELFEYAHKKSINCILDQTLADYSLVNQLLLEEEKYWQGWSLTPFTVNETDLQLMHREHREQDIADHIVCGSNFVKDSLIARGIDSNKISVIPLGRLKDPQEIYPQDDTQILQRRSEELKILFVGSVGLRKGIPYLLEALKKLKGTIPFTCKAIGSLEIRPERVIEYSDVCHFMGRVPRSQVKSLYSWADVFVLPSICEGSAMVTYEALSLGIPIITTHNSGSIVRDGIDGFLVPIRDIDAIVEKLLEIYAQASISKFKIDSNKYLYKTMQKSEERLYQILTQKTI